MANLKQRLEELIFEYKISLEELAPILTTNKSTLSRIKNGHTSLKHDMLDDMANYFGVSSDYILGRSDYRYTIKTDEPLVIEKELLKKIRLLTPQNLDKIMGMVELKIIEQETSSRFLKENR